MLTESLALVRAKVRPPSGPTAQTRGAGHYFTWAGMTILLAILYVIFTVSKLAAPAVSEAFSWACAYLHLAKYVPMATALCVILVNSMGKAQRLWRNDDARRRLASRRRPATSTTCYV